MRNGSYRRKKAVRPSLPSQEAPQQEALPPMLLFSQEAIPRKAASLPVLPIPSALLFPGATRRRALP